MHCLAGRGRTGTALALVNAVMSLQWQIMNLDQSKTSQPILASNVRDHLYLSIFSIVRRLREQRSTAVQASEQYTYIYQFIDKWLNNKILMTKVDYMKTGKKNGQTKREIVQDMKSL